MLLALRCASRLNESTIILRLLAVGGSLFHRNRDLANLRRVFRSALRHLRRVRQVLGRDAADDVEAARHRRKDGALAIQGRGLGQRDVEAAGGGVTDLAETGADAAFLVLELLAELILE